MDSNESVQLGILHKKPMEKTSTQENLLGGSVALNLNSCESLDGLYLSRIPRLFVQTRIQKNFKLLFTSLCAF